MAQNISKDIELYSPEEVHEMKRQAKRTINRLGVTVAVLLFIAGVLTSYATITAHDEWELQQRIKLYTGEVQTSRIEKQQLNRLVLALKEENNAVKASLDTKGQDTRIFVTTAKIQDYYAKAGFNRYNKSYSNLLRIVRAVYELAPKFDIATTEEGKIFRVLAIFRNESGFNPEAVGPYKERGLGQILTRDIPELKDRLRKRGFAVSDNDFAVKTNTLMCLQHLEDKVKQFGYTEEAVKQYNGRKAKPQYLEQWRIFIKVLEEPNS